MPEPSEPTVTPPGEPPAVSVELGELTAELRKLVDRLGPRPSSWWDRLPAITSFIGTVVLAALGLFLSHSYKTVEEKRLQHYQDAQIRSEAAQARVEEFKAITALVPLLASPDSSTRRRATEVLRAVQETAEEVAATTTGGEAGQAAREASGEEPARGRAPESAPSPATRASVSATALLDHYARIAFASSQPDSARVQAVREIGRIGSAPSASATTRERASEIVTELAIAPTTPQAVRSEASEILGRLRKVQVSEVASIIAAAPLTRTIDEVILHHSALPSANYREPETVFSLARFEVENRSWSNVSWHYAIAPDGSIWLGAPLDEAAVHTPRRNASTASVLLFMDGNRELPTDAQKASLRVVLRALFDRLKISAERNFAEGRGFHRDYFPNTSGCPGRLITKELVLQWLAET